MIRSAALCIAGLVAAADAFAFAPAIVPRAPWVADPAATIASSSARSRLHYSNNNDDDADGILNSNGGNSGGKNETGSDPFMSALKARMEQVEDGETKFPIIVLDTMLPRQTLKIELNDPVFKNLIKKVVQQENPSFGVIGFAQVRVPPGESQMVPLQNGVQVTVVGKPELFVPEGMDPNDSKNEYVRANLKANKRFRIIGQVADDPQGGWTEGRVRFYDSKQDEEAEVTEGLEPLTLIRAREMAAQMVEPQADGTSLVDRWINLATACERSPGQIRTLLQDIGPIPPADQPSERAFWVGALINPLPGMGVAMEIRPMLLMSRTAEERVRIALDGLQASIKHMDGTRKLF